jgi:UDP-glucose 4-epimerase
MRVLVTGAAGFLGGHVTRHLMEEGHSVTGFDLTEPESPPTAWIQGDLTDPESLDAAVAGHEMVCHIGAIGDVYLAGEQPALAAQVNAVGSAHIGTAAQRHNARVVYASTWEVYGSPRYEPIDEEHPCAPDHPYNITKLTGEQMLLAADHLHGVPVLALRLGTAYGSGLRPNSVFRIFIDKARRGEPITIQGDGAQGRQFTHASDIARAFALAVDTGLHGTALNIVAPETTSIKELAELVVSRYPTELTFGPPRPGDVPPALVSPERAAGELGWRAQMSFESGLNELMDAH